MKRNSQLYKRKEQKSDNVNKPNLGEKYRGNNQNRRGNIGKMKSQYRRASYVMPVHSHGLQTQRDKGDCFCNSQLPHRHYVQQTRRVTVCYQDLFIIHKSHPVLLQASNQSYKYGDLPLVNTTVIFQRKTKLKPFPLPYFHTESFLVNQGIT